MNQTTARPYRVILAISDPADLDQWLLLATSLCPDSGEVRLRGLVTIAPELSLSEGALPAQQLRDTFDRAAQALPLVHDETAIRVDYHPLARIFDEVRDLPADMIVIQWAGPDRLTGGLSTDEIVAHAPCDVVMVSGRTWWKSGPALLALRGGPNLSLGLRMAKALARKSTVTLFHTAEAQHTTPSLGWLMRADPQITRVVNAVGDFGAGLVQESAGHKAIVMGARQPRPQTNPGETAPVFRTIYDQVTVPMVLVRAHNPEEIGFHLPRRLRGTVEHLSTRVDRWFAENTFHSHEFEDLRALLALKEQQGLTISVGLPALNESATVGKVISTIKRALMDDLPLLDEIVLIDSDSTDDTIAIAQSFGIPTFRHSEILPEQGSYRGKGEALWKSLHVLKGDLIAWIDTDITNIHPRFIYGLIGPLLKRPHLQFVKGFYRRPIKVGDQLQALGGGRVTELVARPMLNLFYPELSGVVQPLSGEYAGRRTALEAIPFFSGYGVETAMLLDLHDRYGLDGIAQVDLEERIHHNQSLIALSKMSFAIHQVFVSRLETRYGLQLLDKANGSMKLIAHGPDRFALDIAEIGDVERPPMILVPAYNERRSVPETSR